MQSRATALGWGSTTRVAVVAGSTPAGGSEGVVDGLRRSAAKLGVDSLAAVQGRRLVCILGNVDDPMEAARELEAHFGEGAIVVGPTVPHLFAAGRSARAALAGQSCAHAAGGPAPRLGRRPSRRASSWVTSPPGCTSSNASSDRCRRVGAGTSCRRLRSTSRAAADSRSTARILFVHPNTVRYRLGKVADLTGYDLTDPRRAHRPHRAGLSRHAPHRAPRSPLSLSSNM